MSNIDKQALKPGLYAILFRNNWDGEGDTYEMLASLDANLTWHNYETGKELFEYEGDEILKSWLLNDSTTTDALEAAEKRIAELETRTVTLPTPYPKGYGLVSDKYNFALEECADAIRAAGIGVKGE
ncbi:hypothetical protein [Citrobacter portucalensis]|uniref:hypothetical protein n=1 Tax=Citrobacter portucalensis TaxID=1639133 RepID=UPI001F160221|nr:hypothetical protein [Citrobacter portucalensis]MCE9759216.1 hypothetical protein [Citrobacter portucalensis]